MKMPKTIKMLSNRMSHIENKLEEISQELLYAEKRVEIEMVENIYSAFLLEYHEKPQYILIPENWIICWTLGKEYSDWIIGKLGEPVYLDSIPIFRVKGLSLMQCLVKKDDNYWKKLATPLSPDVMLLHG